MTEAGHVSDLMTRMALSHPHISFQFINNGQSKLHTSGNGNLRDVIYHIYGREIAANLINVTYEKKGIRFTGNYGAPLISRGNRNFETYFINGRYVKSSIIYKAIEDAYKDFTMQHKYPFTVLHIEVVGEDVDVNVHPTKMEVRFHILLLKYYIFYEKVDQAFFEMVLSPEFSIDVPKAEPKAQAIPEPKAQPKEVIQPEVNNSVKVQPEKASGERDLDYFMEQMKKRVMSYHQQNSSAEVKGKSDIFKPQVQVDRVKEVAASYRAKQSPEQMTLFDGKLLDKEKRANYKIIGQVFDTYWLVEFDNSLYIIDQHAAHERVLFEKTLREMKTREFTSQMISPPVILNLTMQEAQLLRTYMDQFTRIGFEFEEFGQDSYAVRSVPANLFSIAKKELLMEMIDSLSEEVHRRQSLELLDEKIASMSCKAAVKGNMRLSAQEVDALIGELLKLDNPYHCPHGRPTIISMSKRELEKKFKRIV